MRFKLSFELENENIPIDYRRSIISFMKKSLEEYNQDLYNTLYHAKDPIVKPFTFSVYFPSPNFKKDYIGISEKRLEVNLSNAENELSILMSNSFNQQKNKPFLLENNSMTLKTITLLPEQEIAQEQIKIKFMSPLIVRSRQNQKDRYYSYEHEEFEETLKINIKEQLKITKIPLETVETLKLEPINSKKTVIRFYEKQIEASIGSFTLSGVPELLDYLYKAGIGSKRASRLWDV